MGLNNFTGKSGNDDDTVGGSGGGIPKGYPMSPGGEVIDPLDMLINYNEKFQSAGTILFRDELVQQTLGVLIGKNKPNAMLVGPAGVGKTKIVEDIAYRLQTKDPIIPDKLDDPPGEILYESTY